MRHGWQSKRAETPTPAHPAARCAAGPTRDALAMSCRSVQRSARVSLQVCAGRICVVFGLGRWLSFLYSCVVKVRVLVVIFVRLYGCCACCAHHERCEFWCRSGRLLCWRQLHARLWRLHNTLEEDCAILGTNTTLLCAPSHMKNSKH